MDLCIGMCGMAFAQSQVASTLDAFHLTASIAGAGVSRSKCHFKYKNEKFKKCVYPPTLLTLFLST